MKVVGYVIIFHNILICDG